jgi:predicted aminopeptidase
MKMLITICSCFLCLAFLAACSPVYVIEAAYNQTKILSRREKISKLLRDEERLKLSPEIAKKLELVLKARHFAEEIGLKPKGSFKYYSPYQREVLTWVVMACPPDSFNLKSWWFPFVGRVPYKGFFDLEDAKDLANDLKEGGYEVSVRGSDAFSTLGWFDDPVLTPALNKDDIRIVNTVIHESLHTTLWVKGQVEFNESLANVVGMYGAIEFFKNELKKCQNPECQTNAQEALQKAKEQLEEDLSFGRLIDQLYRDLNQLYLDPSLSREEKLLGRSKLWSEQLAPYLMKLNPRSRLLTPNNAEILQYSIYYRELDLFVDFINLLNGDIKLSLQSFESLANQLNNNDDLDPFSELRKIVASATTKK